MKKKHHVFIWTLSLWAIFCLPRDGISAPDVEIIGSERFTNQIVQALTLLKRKAPEAHGIVISYVKRIEQGARSGMWAYKTPPKFEMGDRTTFYSVTWCAAAIAHDSLHSKLYHNYKAMQHGPVPDAIWTGTEAEKLCMQHQLAVMERIGAPKNEIDHAKRLADAHYVNDKETWRDYQKRNW